MEDILEHECISNLMHILHVLFLILSVGECFATDRALQVLLTAVGSIAMESQCLMGIEQLPAVHTHMLVVHQAQVPAERFLVWRQEGAEGTRKQIFWALVPHSVG